MTHAAILVLLAMVLPAKAQLPQTPTTGQWGDQTDGTYANPVLPADFSDIDAIGVGSRFYAISSTFQYSPGMAVLESSDLVNWRIAAHVVPDLTRISPALNWDKMDRPARGIWAGSIRHHAGRFWVFFGTPDEGLFMSSAATAEGPWTPVANLLPQPGWDDPCPLWDDDGRLYLVATHFQPEPDGTPYTIHLFELTPGAEHIRPRSGRILHQSPGSEANKLYKIHGLYFHLYSEVAPEGRVVMMARATSLQGPWQRRQLIHVNAPIDKEPNQGGLIELPSGKWFFLTHQGTGDWEGRAAALLPVTWIDGWPILGKPGPDGIGNMVWRAPKPIASSASTAPISSGSFDQPQLDSAWEWNYQPRAPMWSLVERPGFLRLRAFPSLRAGDFAAIGNILAQRAMRTPDNEVTVQFELANMADGQTAGLAHYAKTFATLGVLQQGETRRLVQNDNGHITEGPPIPAAKVWLRSTWNFAGESRFSFSLDGATFTPFGPAYQLTWGNYRGDRIGLYTVNPDATAGFIDIPTFHYEVAR